MTTSRTRRAAARAGHATGSLLVGTLLVLLLGLAGCVPAPSGPLVLPPMPGPLDPAAPPLTASAAIGLGDATRDGSLRLVIEGLDEDARGDHARALAQYQRAIRVDPTNPFAFLALSRHHLEGGSFRDASGFLDQARSLFEAEGQLGPSVDVWGLGLRAAIDRAYGRDDRADEYLARAQRLAPSIWRDGRLSARELR